MENRENISLSIDGNGEKKQPFKSSVSMVRIRREDPRKR